MHQITHGVIQNQNPSEQSIPAITCATFNRLNCTQRMLASLNENTTTPFHLIIIDNGSSDDTSQFLATYKLTNSNCVSFEVYYNKENMGGSWGRNQGLKLATKYDPAYFCVFDNDVEFPKDWLKDCVGILETNRYLSIGINYEDRTYPLQTINGGYTIQMKPQGNLNGACMMFSKELFSKIGYFHCYEGFRYGPDDADMGMRQRLAGYQLGYLKENGVHFGAGQNEPEEYREWKNQQNRETIPVFKQNCMEYIARTRPLYISFDWEPEHKWQQI